MKKNKISLKERQIKADTLITQLLAEGYAMEQARFLLRRATYNCGQMVKGLVAVPEQTIIPTVTGAKKLLGMQSYVNDIDVLMQNGSKGIFLAGFHGLGKSSIVSELASQYQARLIRIQITEMTSEMDLVGSPNPQTGEFINSEFVSALLDATKNPTQKYFVLLDEFTRGRDEALNVLYPLLAEKTLFINSPYSQIKEIKVPSNIVIFATGNLHDRGQREIGQAEADRYNIIEIDFIKDKNILEKILKQSASLADDHNNALIETYLKSIELYAEFKILAMSIRTLIESAKVWEGIIQSNPGISMKDGFTKTMQLTYYGTSQAMLNPNFKLTYNDIIKKIARRF